MVKNGSSDVRRRNNAIKQIRRRTPGVDGCELYSSVKMTRDPQGTVEINLKTVERKTVLNQIPATRPRGKEEAKKAG